MRRDSRAYCFTDGQNILTLTQQCDYILLGWNKPFCDRFAHWLRRRCEQHMATRAHDHDKGTDVNGGVTWDL
jgi:hypothetical protein